MLTYKLWVEVGLVNCVLGYIHGIFYMPGSNPPHLLMYITFFFYKYIGVPFEKNNPNLVPITLKQIHRNMSWALIIHKSYILSLELDIIDIRKKE
jgi:hypothetical protein